MIKKKQQLEYLHRVFIQYRPVALTDQLHQSLDAFLFIEAALSPCGDGLTLHQSCTKPLQRLYNLGETFFVCHLHFLFSAQSLNNVHSIFNTTPCGQMDALWILTPHFNTDSYVG